MDSAKENVIEICYKDDKASGNASKDDGKIFFQDSDGSPDDADNTITFWNIEQDNAIVKLDTLSDNIDSGPVSKLVDKLEQTERASDKHGVNGEIFQKNGENASFTSRVDEDKAAASECIRLNEMTGSNPGATDTGEIQKNDTKGDANRRGSLKEKRPHDVKIDRLNSSNDDSDIQEIDINFEAFDTNENKVKGDLASKPEVHVNRTKLAGQDIDFNFIDSGNVQNKTLHHHDSNPWGIGQDETDIFTKSLILSGITESSQTASNKRPFDQFQISPERQSKRARTDHVSENYDSDRTKHHLGGSTSVDSAEFCPPVAVVYPMEPDSRKMSDFGHYVDHSKQSGLKLPTQVFSSQINNQIQKISHNESEINHGPGKAMSEKQQFNQYLPSSNATGKVSEAAKDTVHADLLGNFEFDFEIQESKDDFPIDITPTINPLEEYEEVLAGLIADSKPNKEHLANQVTSSVSLNEPSVSLKDQINSVPPNVTFSTALASVSSSIDRFHTSTFPQGIARNIEHMAASSTMKPFPNVSSSGPHNFQAPFSNGMNRPMLERRHSYHHMPMRNDGSAHPLQTFSLHNDSNLLRKMISTPITDSYDNMVPTSASSGNNRASSAPTESSPKDLATATAEVIKTEVTVDVSNGSAKIQDDNSVQALQNKPPVPGATDKPALSEQVRARVTLHHTGTKEQQDQSIESAAEPSSQGWKALEHSHTSIPGSGASQAQYPAHLQQPLSVKTQGPYNRGMQDVLLQHSIRRRQLAMRQQYGDHSLPSSQYGGHAYPPAGFPHGHNLPDFTQQRREPSPFSQITDPSSATSALKADMNMMDKTYLSQMMQRRSEMGGADPTRSGYNTRPNDMPGSVNSSNSIHDKQFPDHQRNQTNRYAYSTLRHPMIPPGDPSSVPSHSGHVPSHMHPFLKHHGNRYSNLSAQVNRNSDLLAHGARPPGLPMHRLPTHASKDQYPNFPSHQFPHGHTPAYHRHPLSTRPQLESDAQQNPGTGAAGAHMPFMQHYHSMAQRGTNPADKNPYANMAPAMHGRPDDRGSGFGGTGSQADMGMRSSQQYSSGIAGQPQNFGVR